MKTLRTLFKDIEAPRQREALSSEIFLALLSLKNSQLRRRAQISYAGLLFSGVSIVYTGFVYGGAFVGSEFWSILSLFVSDVSVVANYWNEFALLLLETIPIIPILLMLIPTFIFLLFLSMYYKTRAVHRLSF
jgi:ABC-type transport system involved in cytochrome bd biosynthesis fused ATPase/permease subunit